MNSLSKPPPPDLCSVISSFESLRCEIFFLMLLRHGSSCCKPLHQTGVGQLCKCKILHNAVVGIFQASPLAAVAVSLSPVHRRSVRMPDNSLNLQILHYYAATNPQSSQYFVAETM